MPTALPHRPYVLLILDGWGYREDTENNAISQASTPVWDALWKRYPHCLISGSGADVGLPADQMGNSEVGHLNMGAGRLVPQELGRLNQAIADGQFFENPALCQAVDQVVNTNKTLHILGLVSEGGVHSHVKHLLAMIRLAAGRGAKKIRIHAFLDGRDTPPQSALPCLKAIEQTCAEVGIGGIASLCGRYYAMDRDKRWSRTQQAYELLTEAKAPYQASSAAEGLSQAYARGETDEFVKPTLILPASPIEAGDAIVFMNFRADRARQLTRALTEPAHEYFTHRPLPTLSAFVTLTEYASDIAATVAYPPQTLKNGLGEYVSNLGYRQLRLAETEKYAHVTFFFNGGVEAPFRLEDRLLIPSAQVATYDLKPEMSAPEITNALVEAIQKKHYDLIICNYANADMVGHTGNLAATVRAIECIDTCLGRVITALQAVGGEALITADHGNAELMFDHHTDQPHTAHTCNPVPLLYVGRSAEFMPVSGTLSDIAPTLLSLMGLSIPPEMLGKVLLTVKK